MVTAPTDTVDLVRYPLLDRPVSVGDIMQRCECPCVLVYQFGEWYLKPCFDHEWKVRT